MCELKGSELRIGNYIEYNGINGLVYCIQSPFPRKEKRFNDKELVTLIIGGMSTICISECKPIPLTESWLINLGFEKIGQNFRKFEDHGYGLGMTEFVVWYNANKKTYNIKAINILVGIETVHRLQNVYHSLTGKELTQQTNN